ncbi:hypothetical protein GOBAR_DD29265 [Gossypium barbadense]|nr:hypothetical protein GOBAR_DD29265 [Gossypium barbadense]
MAFDNGPLILYLFPALKKNTSLQSIPDRVNGSSRNGMELFQRPRHPVPTKNLVSGSLLPLADPPIPTPSYSTGFPSCRPPPDRFPALKPPRNLLTLLFFFLAPNRTPNPSLTLLHPPPP